MRVVIATIVHHPEDARIRHRQISALLEAGIAVTYIAPAGDTTPLPDGLLRVEVPRATARHRVAAWRGATQALRRETPGADLTIVHDPELTLLDRWISGPRIWDVHEDLPAQISDKQWIPALARTVARTGAAQLQRRAKRRFVCTIAETGYARTFPHAVLVRNTVRVPAAVPPSGHSRAVYLGRVSIGRGARILAEVSRLLPDAISLEVIGPVDPVVESLPRNRMTIHGFVPNERALTMVQGATVGLSLLDDLPNYRHSMPTKVLEYLAEGVPVVTTPLAAARAIVEEYDCGVVVPFGDPAATARAIVELNSDAENRQRLADNGRAAVRQFFAWEDDAARMIELYRSVALR